MKTYLFILAVSITVAFSSLVQAGEGERERHHRGPVYEKIIDGARMINLSEEKLVEIIRLAEMAEPDIELLREDVQAEKEELHWMLGQEDISNDEISEQAEKVAVAEKTARIAEVKVLLDMRVLLSKEEWKAIRSVTGERRKTGGNSHVR